MFDSTRLEVFDFPEFLGLEAPENYYVIGPEILPRGGRLVLHGQTKVGKTYCFVNLMVSLASGGKVWGHPEWKAQKSRVLIIDKELGKYSFAKRLKKILNTEDASKLVGCKVLPKPRGFNLMDSVCIDWLKKFCVDNAIDAVILDPLGRMSFYDLADIAATNRLLNTFEEIQENNVSVIFSVHNKKPPRGKDAEGWDELDLYNSRGAGLVEDADAVLSLSRRPGRLVLTHESWALDCRFTLRHAESPPIFTLHVNEHADGRVLFHAEKIDEPPEPKTPKTKTSYFPTH